MLLYGEVSFVLHILMIAAIVYVIIHLTSKVRNANTKEAWVEYGVRSFLKEINNVGKNNNTSLSNERFKNS